MGWTDAATHTSGYVVTADDWTNEVKQNARYLKGKDGIPTIESGLIIDNTDGDEYLQIPSLTTTERNALTPVNGMVIYNETTTEFNKYEAGAWKDLGGGTDHGGLDGLGDDDHTIYQKEDLLTTQGDMPYATAASTWARLPKGTASQLLRMNSGATAPEWATLTTAFTVVRKTADEIVNNSSTLQNDDELLLAIGANAVWIIDLTLITVSASATPDVKIGFTYPVGCTVAWLGTKNLDTVASSFWGTSTDTQVIEATTSDRLAAHIRVTVVNGANAGNFQLQWAQNSATVEDTKVRINSCLIAYNLA